MLPSVPAVCQNGTERIARGPNLLDATELRLNSLAVSACQAAGCWHSRPKDTETLDGLMLKMVESDWIFNGYPINIKHMKVESSAAILGLSSPSRPITRERNTSHSRVQIVRDRPDRVGVPPFFKGGWLLQGRASLKGSLQCGAAPPRRRRRGEGAS